jgi:carbamate kinase
MKSMVLAVGGNALIHRGEQGTIREQRENTRRVAKQIAQLASGGYRIVVTHGNGPQVGAELLLSETAAGRVPSRSLDLCDASTQGEMGYLLQQALKSELTHIGLSLPVVTIVTQCVVSLDDPAMKNPTKPVGRFLTSAEAAEYTRQFGWTFVMDAGRGYRRVVPSPQPTEIVEFDMIQELFDSGALVIACGGGGIPVAWQSGELVGVEAVIDKDLTSSLLASQLATDLFVIGTDTDCVYLDYNKATQRALHRIHETELEEHLQAGQFAPGSMGPKITSVLQFLRRGGIEAIVASSDQLYAAVEGSAGTHAFSRGFALADLQPGSNLVNERELCRK